MIHFIGYRNVFGGKQIGRLRRLVRSDCASTLPEYALIVGAIVAVVLAGTVLLGGQLRAAFSGASASLPAAETRTGRTATSPKMVSGGESSGVPSVLRAKHVWASSALLVAAGLMGLTAGLSRRKRGRPVEDEPTEVRLTPAAETDLDADLGARRQQILRTLLADTSLLVRSRILVGHLMNRRFETVLPNKRAADLVETMRDRKVNVVLVAEPDGRFLGIVGQRAAARSPQLLARDLLSEGLRTTTAEASVSVAISTLVGGRQTCLPVLDEGRLCGTITTTDLVLTLQAALQMFLRLAQYLQVQEQHAPWTEDLGSRPLMPAGPQEIHEVRELLARSQSAGHRDPLPGSLEQVAERCCRLVEQVQEAERQLNERHDRLMAAFELRIDPVTGFANRRAVEERIEQQVQLGHRYGHICSLLVAVSSRPKDEELRELAGTIQTQMRVTDFAGRLDRDSLVIVMPGTCGEDANHLTHRLRQQSPRTELACLAVDPSETAAQVVARLDALLANMRGNTRPAS